MSATGYIVVGVIGCVILTLSYASLQAFIYCKRKQAKNACMTEGR